MMVSVLTSVPAFKCRKLSHGQVFGKLLGGEGEEEEAAQARPTAGDEAVSPERPETSNDLKEHMVGILFSRSKLTHLQKQVSPQPAQSYDLFGAVDRNEVGIQTWTL